MSDAPTRLARLHEHYAARLAAALVSDIPNDDLSGLLDDHAETAVRLLPEESRPSAA